MMRLQRPNRTRSAPRKERPELIRNKENKENTENENKNFNLMNQYHEKEKTSFATITINSRNNRKSEKIENEILNIDQNIKKRNTENKQRRVLRPPNFQSEVQISTISNQKKETSDKTDNHFYNSYKRRSKSESRSSQRYQSNLYEETRIKSNNKSNKNQSDDEIFPKQSYNYPAKPYNRTSFQDMHRNTISNKNNDDLLARKTNSASKNFNDDYLQGKRNNFNDDELRFKKEDRGHNNFQEIQEVKVNSNINNEFHFRRENRGHNNFQERNEDKANNNFQQRKGRNFSITIDNNEFDEKISDKVSNNYNDDNQIKESQRSSRNQFSRRGNYINTTFERNNKEINSIRNENISIRNNNERTTIDNDDIQRIAKSTTRRSNSVTRLTRNNSEREEKYRILFDEFKNKDGSPKKLTINSLRRREPSIESENEKINIKNDQVTPRREKVNNSFSSMQKNYRNSNNYINHGNSDNNSVSNIKENENKIQKNSDISDYTANISYTRNNNNRFSRNRPLNNSHNRNENNNDIEKKNETSNQNMYETSDITKNEEKTRPKIRKKIKPRLKIDEALEQQNATAITIPNYEPIDNSIDVQQHNQTVIEKPRVRFADNIIIPPKKSEPEMIIFPNNNPKPEEPYKEPKDFLKKFRFPANYFGSQRGPTSDEIQDQKKRINTKNKAEIDEFLALETEFKDEDDDNEGKRILHKF